MMKEIYGIKRWEFMRRGNKIHVSGRAFGDSKYEKGLWVRSLAIKHVKVLENALEIETNQAVYKAKYRDHIYNTDDIVPALDTYFDTEDAYVIKLEIEEELERKEMDKKERLLKILSEEYSPFVLLCLNKNEYGHGDCFMVCDDDGAKLHEFQVNPGGYGSSSCLAVDHYKGINIGYFIRNCEAEFMRLNVPDDYEVYIYNSGEETLRCSGRHCGFNLAPDELMRVKEAKTHEED